MNHLLGVLPWTSSQQMDGAMQHCPVLQTRCLPAEFGPDYAYLVYRNHVCEHVFTSTQPSMSRTRWIAIYALASTTAGICLSVTLHSIHPVAFRVHCRYSWHC